MLCPDSLPSDTDICHFVSRHELASVSVCSTVPGFKEATCFVRESGEEVIQLVKRFYYHFFAIQHRSEELLMVQFQKVFAQLQAYQQRVDKVEKDYNKDKVFSKLCGFEEKKKFLCQLH